MKILGFEIRWPIPTACKANPKDLDREIPPGPHCDPLVVHHPQTCDYCRACNDAVAYRIHKAINFTGEHHVGRATCPSEERRPLAQIHAWPGNRPLKREDS